MYTPDSISKFDFAHPSLKRSRRELRKSLDYSLPVMEYSIEVQRKANLAQAGYRFNLLPKTGNFYLYHAIAQTDLMVLNSKIGLAMNPYEQTLFARLTAMHLIEMLDDLNTLIGRDVLAEVSFVFFDEFVPGFKMLNKEFSKVKKVHGKFLREIRNKAAAHKTLNAQYLAEFTSSLNHLKIMNIAIDVQHISSRLVEHCADLVNRYSELLQTFEYMQRLLDEGKTKEEIARLVPPEKIFGRPSGFTTVNNTER